MAERTIGTGRRLVDRWLVGAVPPRWHREQLGAALSPAHPAMRPVARALGHARWSDAHRRLAAHVMTRPARFAVHPALRGELKQRLGAALRGVAAAAAADGAESRAGPYDLLGYTALRFDTQPRGDIDWHLDPVSDRRAPRECWTDVPYPGPVCRRSQNHLGAQSPPALADARPRLLAHRRRAVPRRVPARARELVEANPPLLGINWASMLETRVPDALMDLGPGASSPTPTARPGSRPWTVDLLLGARSPAPARRAAPLVLLHSEHAPARRGARAVRVRAARSRSCASPTRMSDRARRCCSSRPRGRWCPTAATRSGRRTTTATRSTSTCSRSRLRASRTTPDSSRRSRPSPRAMATFMRHICDDEGRYPLIGDDDGGELAPVAGRHPDARVTLGWAAALLDCPELAIDPVPEAVTWLTLALPAAANRPATSAAPLRTMHFPDTGYVAARRGTSHAVFDAGAHGFLNGGHAHADALSAHRGRPRHAARRRCRYRDLHRRPGRCGSLPLHRVAQHADPRRTQPGAAPRTISLATTAGAGTALRSTRPSTTWKPIRAPGRRRSTSARCCL